VSLIRYKPTVIGRALPVLLCHGIFANGRNLDLDADHSLARFFARTGREAYALSLRGTGDSDHPDPKKGRSFHYTLDTFADQDVPAAIATIRELTGAPRVDYVGHSMGGLVAYTYLARGGAELNAVTILGSPARFVWGGKWERLMAAVGPAVVKNLDTVPAPDLAHAIMPLHGEIEGPIELLLINPDNVRPATWKKLIAVGLGTISGGVLRQLTTWIEKDVMVSADGAIDYRARLASVKTPTLVLAGKFDRIAPPPGVKAGYDLLGGERAFFIAGEENGLRHDYGHMDLVVGDWASEEVWPRIEAFFAVRDP
jgi:pimeloyl-ACP methyl ester carboxylesterase